eukprot:7260454-Ditylum_brightwellii.AAC.1
MQTQLTQLCRIGPGASPAATDKAKLIFDDIDVDENGTIEIDELHTTLANLCIPLNAISDICSAFDSNGDNIISKEEWKDGMKMLFRTY